MSLLLNEDITINRISKSYDTNGRAQSGTTAIHTAKGNIQPLKGNEILQLSEGDRERDNLNCFTDFALVVNDEVVRGGLKYEVQNVENWNIFGRLQHFKARMILKERQ